MSSSHDTSEWLEAHYDALEPLTPAERDAYVRARISDAPELLQAVRAMFDVRLPPGERFSDLSQRLSAALLAPPAVLHFGAYHVLREIGRGGMGRVLLAERSDGAFERQVAIKLLPQWAGNSALLALKRECQLLARLDHPHIARLLDAGETADGEPYLIIDYVDGENIAQYCARLRLSIPARIALLLAAAQALAAAHRQLIVHCDIKPGNVLVDRSGAVKVLDFGISTLLADLDRPKAATAGYASPEQLQGGPVDTRADVYGFGVLMGELLAGTAGLAERCLPMSQRASVRAQAPQCGTRESRLRQLLRGDLDAIQRRATAANADDRYSGMAELIDDLTAYGARRPVRARAGGALYATLRWLQRHLWPALATTVGVLIVAGLGARYLIERQLAVQQAQVVRGVAATLRDLQETPPEWASDPNQSVHATILKNAERAARAEHLAPMVRARLYFLFGLALSNVQDWDHAADLLREAIAQRRLAVSGPDLEVARMHAAAMQIAIAAGRVEQARQDWYRLSTQTPYPADAIDELEFQSLRAQLDGLEGRTEAALRGLAAVYRQALALYGSAHLRLAPHARRYGLALQAIDAAAAREPLAVAERLYRRHLGPPGRRTGD